MSNPNNGLPVEMARAIQTRRDGLPPRRLPFVVTRAEWDAMVRRGDVKQVDKLNESAWLSGIAIQIVGDKI